MESHWEPIALAGWRTLPHVAGRVATEADVREGRAVFFLTALDGVEAAPHGMDLPALAVHVEEGTGVRTPVVVIQAERARERCIVGVRFFNGGNRICLLGELELIEERELEEWL